MTDSHGILPDDEPKTPMWLPGLGAALFVAVALWWAVTPATPAITADEAVPSAAAAAPAAAPHVPSQAPSPSPQAALAAGSAAPAHSGMMRLNPAVEERLKKLREGQAPAQPGPHP
ncbi:MAG TPA: hypothetical protein VHS09_16105 [Polyangiaceae bacterium]|nr:hypothetical protein [Polyangiaceae bacterium]